VDCAQANMPKEIADYLNKMGARIPNIKPGKATIEYLTKVQASTRFWGMLLVNDCNFRVIFYFFTKYISSTVNSLPCGKFVGGLLLSVLATTSSVLDHYLRRVNAGFAIGFTSVLIIVSARRILVIVLCMQTHW